MTHILTEQGRSNYRPLHIAAAQNNVECVQVLINIGVDVNAITVSVNHSHDICDSSKPKAQIGGYTPLFMAQSGAATQCAELLRAAGARIESDESTHQAQGT